MTPSDRREEIRNIISTERVTSVADLMERFGVCKNTILHDLDVITPTTSFTTTSGRGGGITATPGWYASDTRLNKKQEELLRRLLPGLQTEDQKTMESILYTFGLPVGKRVKDKTR